MEISGYVATGFEDLADAYGRLAAEHSEHASSLCVRYRGSVVAQLGVNGYAPSDRQMLFSGSKIIVALALFLAHDDGILDLDAPFSRYWRELGAGTGSAVTLRDVLSHKSGFFRLVEPMDVDTLLSGGDIKALCRQTRDTRFDHAYHAFTYGSLVTGALAALSLPSIANLIDSYLAKPLHLDTRLYTSEAGAETEFEEIRPVRFSPPAMISRAGIQPDGLPVDQALLSLLSDVEIFNSRAFLTAEVASMGVVSSSDSLARLMSATIGEVDGVRILTDRQREELCRERTFGRDGALGVSTRFGTGVQLPFPRSSWTSAAAFGHEGAGGSVAFADPKLHLGVGFTTDQFPRSPGASPVITSLYGTLRHLVEQQFLQE
jgi:CubicO group peptidase (beta-lactamase class C family)